MRKHPIFVSVLLITAGALATAPGCELLTSVDRTKLQGNGGYGGSTTTTTATTTATATCASGGVACAVASDCPGPSSSCVAATCTAGCCGTTNVATGMTCDDPGGTVCDGNGKCIGCLAATDCPTPATKCLTGACNTTGHTCGTSPAASGTTCTDNGGQVCDGAGNCVACVSASSCPTSSTACKVPTCDATAHTCGLANAPLGTACTDNNGVVCNGHGTCVATHCTDGVQDADETDVDCGGSSCGPCADTQKCLVGTDCVNLVCTGADGGTEGTCAYPSCADGVQNGDETDVDCGGSGYVETTDGGVTLPSCAPCADKKHCGQNTDCANNECFGFPGVCVSCMDGIQDGNETDVDCGGVDCDGQGKACPNNDLCDIDNDCQSTFCPSGTCEGIPDGNPCTASAQCANDNCITAGGNQFCCDTACTGACQSCLGTLTGQATGTCASLPTGTACASSSDPLALVCGDTTNPSIAGTCVECNQDSDCTALADGGTGSSDGGTGGGGGSGTGGGGAGGSDAGSQGPTLTCNASTGICQ